MSDDDKPHRFSLNRREWVLMLILVVGTILFLVAASFLPKEPAKGGRYYDTPLPLE